MRTKSFVVGGVLLLSSATAWARGDITIDDTGVYPESITSTKDGAVFSGSMKGVVYRAGPNETTAKAWVKPSAENGLQAVFGVLADERAKMLWACSVANPFAGKAAGPSETAVVAFNLATAAFTGRYPFPAVTAPAGSAGADAPAPTETPASRPPVGNGVCNDIAVAGDGTLYASDTPNGRILKLAPGAKSMTLFGEDARLKGIDGLTFAGDGTLYVNIVSSGALLRVDRKKDGTMGTLTDLTVSRPLAGPDGFRLISGNRFLVAEGPAGRIDEVTIDGNKAKVRVLKEGLNGSPSVTLVDETVYAAEGKIGYLIDPKLKGQDPGAFKIHAIPLK